MHNTNNLSYNIYNHGNKGLGHKLCNLITSLPGNEQNVKQKAPAPKAT